MRVWTLAGEDLSLRLQAVNLSKGGMFLATKAPLELGAEVALSLEASGRVFPFAIAAVAWSRGSAGRLPAGVGVRFLRFLHPRAAALVEHVVGGPSQAGAGGRQRAARRRPMRSARAGLLLGVAAAGVVAAVGLALERSAAPDSAAPRDAAIASMAPAASGPTQEEGAVVGDDRPPLAPAGAAGDASDAAPKQPPLGAGGGLGSLGAAAGSTPPSSGGVPLGSGAVHRLQWELGRDEVRIEPVLAPGATIARQFLLEEPPRLVLDVTGPEPRRSFTVSLAGAPLKRARVGALAGGTRVVIDLGAEPSDLLADDGAAILSF